jgi:protein-S-isoprenylcysteine O-methyltransferase Ste14
MTPAPLALLAAIVGGLATALVLLLGVLSLVGGTTRPEMLGLAGPVVILPAGLVALAAGLYAGRRLWATLRPPAETAIPESDDGSP